MATAKKSSKGNKTAHVLNLLTAPGEAAPAPVESEAETPVQEEAQSTAGRPLLPPILEVAQSNDDSLAQQIQQALEEEFIPADPPQVSAVESSIAAPVQETAPAPAPVQEKVPVPEPQPAPAPSGAKMSQDDIEKMLASMGTQEEPPAPQPAPAPSGAKMSQDDIEKMLASMGAQEEPPAPQPAPAPSGAKMSQDDIEKMLASMGTQEVPPAPQPAPAPSGAKMSQDDIEKMLASMGTQEVPPAPQPAPPAAKPAPEPEEEMSYINVMQALVEEKALRYMKKFGLCTCKHCEADVKALTLTNLVPKYVVLSKQDRIPMLTVYEGRYNSTIFAQLTRACKVVMDHPHHAREK